MVFHYRLSSRVLATANEETKKADVAAHPQVFGHVGLLADSPPGTPGCPSTNPPII
jgi:hypothetical protein